ncbi:Hypothetical predicted protein [Paramuricea clavata]|uniref:Uncharacterized protein n=1 Tax=Paramuricea clavata TaxID=317549 RepID=A0A6S7JZD9_PARCT|nr:Hypothetical predicted protein [Paramuricea clavata]
MNKGLSSLLVALTVLSVNSQDILVPSSENVFETQQALVLPMTLECPFVRHKHIEIHGVTLLNGSDVLIASSLAPNIEKLTNEECFASLVQSDDKPARCNVSMQALPQDGIVDQMDKIVTFDCRKSLGDPSQNVKTISKKKGTINMKCDNKDAVPEIIDISLASGQSVDRVSCNWECSQENIQNINKDAASLRNGTLTSLCKEMEIKDVETEEMVTKETGMEEMATKETARESESKSVV